MTETAFAVRLSARGAEIRHLFSVVNLLRRSIDEKLNALNGFLLVLHHRDVAVAVDKVAPLAPLPEADSGKARRLHPGLHRAVRLLTGWVGKLAAWLKAGGDFPGGGEHIFGNSRLTAAVFDFTFQIRRSAAG